MKISTCAKRSNGLFHLNHKGNPKMKKPYFIFLVFCIITVFLGCSSSKNTSQEKSSAFAGIWNFAYEGIYIGTTEVTIDHDGQFRTTISVTKDSHTFTNDIYGEVNETGEVVGSILLSGKRIGSFSGTIKENAGTGEYKTQRGEGSWNLTKK